MERLSRVAFVISSVALLILLAWAYGYSVGKGKAWPSTQVEPAIDVVKSIWTYGEIVPEGTRKLAPPGASRSAVALHSADAAMGSGYYALMGWSTSPHVELYDHTGRKLHTWHVDWQTISHNKPYNSKLPHPMHVLDDGTVIIGFDQMGTMARIDSCGEIIWAKDGFYHHSYSPSSDGSVWTWFGSDTAYGQFQYIVKFDPATGDTLQSIGLVEDIIGKNPEFWQMFSAREDNFFVEDSQMSTHERLTGGVHDIFHPNDVEELRADLAPAFPTFDAGDLLISIRNMNMIAVIDQIGKMKWVTYGPWNRQHDPDFLPSGRISVFNNNVDRSTEQIESNILSIDPTTNEVRNDSTNFEKSFFTPWGGKHQYLPNGNVLLTVPGQGQVLEYTAQGAVAVEFNNVADDLHNNVYVNAQWFAEGYFKELPRCDRAEG